jgi:hypothetical protein
MNPLRRKADSGFFGRDCVVDYSTEITDEQIRAAEEQVRPEFETGDWVTIEEEP